MGRSWQSSKLIILFKSLLETLILLSIRMCEWEKSWELEGVKKEKGREGKEQMDGGRKNVKVADKTDTLQKKSEFWVWKRGV